MDIELLPGGDLVEAGIQDLKEEKETIVSLLVSIGSPKLRWLGFEVPTAISDPETKLYLRLQDEHGDAAHSKYNALVRRLVSFERAATCVS